jgi:hypothetical protein
MVIAALFSRRRRTVPVSPEPATIPVCPECGAEVVYDLTCHTYSVKRDNGTEAWVACMPCDSAVGYICVRELDDDGECGWRYTHGLNPRNPRAAENEQRRPSWISQGQPCGEWRAPGVRLIGSL